MQWVRGLDFCRDWVLRMYHDGPLPQLGVNGLLQGHSGAPRHHDVMLGGISFTAHVIGWSVMSSKSVSTSRTRCDGSGDEIEQFRCAL